MNKYECAVVVAPGLDSEALKNTTQKYTEIITSGGGVVTGVDDWGKRALAYEIDYNKEGYYHFYKFEGTNEVLDELGRRLRLDENVIRHMIVKDVGIEFKPLSEEAAAEMRNQDRRERFDRRDRRDRHERRDRGGRR